MALTKISQAGAKDEAINEAKLQISNAGTNGQYLQKQSGNTGGLTWATVSAGMTDIVSDTSPQLGGNLDVNTKNIVFGDSSGASDDRLTFGAGTDLSIYHDGSNNYINSTIANGDLILDTAQNFYLKHSGENMIKAVNDGTVELYHNGAKKFETHQYGVDISGNVYIGDSGEGKLLVGAGEDLQLYHDATNSVIDNNTGNLYINSAGDVYLCPKDSEAGVYVRADGSVELYYDNAKKFETISTGVKVTGNLHLNGGSSGTNSYIYTNNAAGIIYQADDNGHTFQTYASSAWNTRLTITDGGNVRVPDNGKFTAGASDDLQIYHDGTNSYIVNTTGSLKVREDSIDFQNGAGDENLAKFAANGAVKLYYDNSTKLETRSDGILVSGNIQLNDNNRLDVGSNGDLQIKHDGANTYFTNSTGELVFNSDTIRLRKQDGLEDYIKCEANAAVKLYYNGSEKFRTNAGGTQTFGNMYSQDNCIHYFGDGNDLQIYHNGNNTFIEDTGTGDFYIRGADNVRIQSYSDNEDMAKFIKNGAVELYHNNIKRLGTTSNGIEIESTSGDVKIFTTCSTSGYNQICFGDTDDNDRGSILYNHVGDSMQFTSGTEEKLRITPTTMSWYDGGAERMRFGTHGELGVAGAGSINYGSSGQVLTSGGSSAGMQWKTPGGKILQVLHYTKTDTWSQGSIACGNVSNNAIQLDITPSSSSNKILISVSVMISFNSDANRVGAVLRRGGTELGIGDADGNRQQVTASTVGDNDTAVLGCVAFTYLDSPSTTSAITYGVGLSHGSGSAKTMYLNRGGSDANNCYRFRSGSHITLQEIAG